LFLLCLFLFAYNNSFSQITFSITTQQTTCSGNCNGTATITPLSGTPPYNYWWNGTVLSSNLTNLCVGQYSVLVTDANLVSDIAIVNITSLPGGVTATTTYTNNTKCNYPADGIVDITANNGVAPYTYDWADGNPLNTIHNTNSHLTNIMSGNYSYTVTDAVGCMFTNTVNMPYPSYPSFSVTTTQSNAACTGICNGSANIIVTGAPGPYIYKIHYAFNSYSVTTASLTNLCAGAYTITVIDSASGCGDYSMLYISNNGNSIIPNTVISSISSNETCLNTGNGSIDLNIAGSNNGPFTYLWSNGATTQDIYNLQSNIYSVRITDASSHCMTISDTVSFDGVNCGSISGNVYVDNNSDCVKNSGDINFNGAIVVVNPGNRIGYANTNGDYVINNLPYGTYSVSQYINMFSNILPTCSSTINTSVNSGNPNSTNNTLIAGYNSSTQPDLTVSGYVLQITPGFSNSIYYALNNLDSVNTSGLFKVTLPSAFIPNITSISPSTYTIIGDTIIWNFQNITSSSNTQYYQINFITPVNTSLGSLFKSCIYAQSNIPDFNPFNNTYCCYRNISGSFDPNDKTVSPVGVGPNGDIAATVTDLTYLIRFQNTGNGPAVNIVVKDTLSPNVDVKTFEILGSSHNYNIEILPGNILNGNSIILCYQIVIVTNQVVTVLFSTALSVITTIHRGLK